MKKGEKKPKTAKQIANADRLSKNLGSEKTEGEQEALLFEADTKPVDEVQELPEENEENLTIPNGEIDKITPIDELIIPDDVYDANLYREYMRTLREPILNERRFFKSKTTGKTVSLGGNKNHLAKKIELLGFTKSEQKDCLALKQVYDKTHAMSILYKRQAYRLGMSKEDGGEKVNIMSKQAELIDLFGRMFSLKEVHEICLKDWKWKEVTIDALRRFRQKNDEVILAKIEEHKRNYSDIRLGTKKSRLEELIELFRDRKRIYKGTKTREDHRLLMVTLEQIRKEAEGDRFVMDGKIEVDIQAEISAHLRSEVLNTLNIKEIILARAASKMGINVTVLIQSLSKSYYARFGSAMGARTDENLVVFPSSQTYDFNAIDANHRNDMIREAKVESDEDIQKERDGEDRRDDVVSGLISKIENLKNNVSKKKIETENIMEIYGK